MGEYNPEAIGFDAAFDEGERQLREQYEAKLAGLVSIPVIGGPLDGNRFRIPTEMLQGELKAPFEVPFEIGEATALVVGEKHKRVAVYRLDPSSAAMKFKEITRLSAA